MLRQRLPQQSFYSDLYQKIPKDHILRLIADAVDFSFVNEMLKDSYSKNLGRPAKEPEMMVKLLLLQRLYNLSDVRVIEESSLNLAFMWFLGLNPEDDLIDASLLAKFRTQRLAEGDLDEMITTTISQCVDKGIIKGGDIGIDATHTEANTKKKVPERLMKHLAKNIINALEDELGYLPGDIDTQIPDYKSIKDHKQAKEVMYRYLSDLMERLSPYDDLEQTKAAVDEAQAILADDKFMVQKGLRSLVDQDARVGAKSRNARFFGYKSEVVMDLDSRIISAVGIHSGEYTDGTDFDELIQRTIKSGLKVESVFGDKAYFRRDILDQINSIEAQSYIPVSACAYKIDEELYSYNKDSDQWFCAMGNYTVSKKTRKKNARGKVVVVYKFSKDQCRECLMRKRCMGKQKGAGRVFYVTTSTPLFYAESQRQKDPAFIETYKKRTVLEGKNAELKCHHGMAKANGYGLSSVSKQVKLTVLAVNLKRIAAIVSKQKNKTNMQDVINACLSAVFCLLSKSKAHCCPLAVLV